MQAGQVFFNPSLGAFRGLSGVRWKAPQMEFYSRLFTPEWREREDPATRARYSQHHESLASQVMASRHEIAYLHNELHRVSHDLAQAMVINRALLKLLLSQGAVAPEALEQALNEVLQEHEPAAESESPASKFCEDCGRPLPVPGQECPYCSEVSFTAPEPPKSGKGGKGKSRKKKGKKQAKSQEQPEEKDDAGGLDSEP